MLNQRDIVLLSFPFSDLKSEKVRPAIIVSNDKYNGLFEDIIVVPMTSNLNVRDHAILLRNKDLESGKLIKDSKVKVDRILSVDKSLVRMTIGRINKEVHDIIIETLISIIK